MEEADGVAGLSAGPCSDGDGTTGALLVGSEPGITAGPFSEGDGTTGALLVGSEAGVSAGACSEGGVTTGRLPTEDSEPDSGTEVGITGELKLFEASSTTLETGA